MERPTEVPGPAGVGENDLFSSIYIRAHVERDSGLHIQPVSRFYYLSEYSIA